MDITIPDVSRDTDRGQVGIETLIIFIAMILVAAIAASVLINTAGYLQNQASATSEDSEAQVSNQVLVLSSIGELSEANVVTLEHNGSDWVLTTENSPDISLDVNGTANAWNPSNGDYVASSYSAGNTISVAGNDSGETIELSASSTSDTDSSILTELDTTLTSNVVSEVRMTVMQSPGANEIDLEGASVEYIGPDGEATLGYAESAAVGSFAVAPTTDPDGTAPVLTSREDRFTLEVMLDSDDTADLRYLQEGEEATVRIVTQSGSVATSVINVPQSLSSYEDGDAVEL